MKIKNYLSLAVVKCICLGIVLSSCEMISQKNPEEEPSNSVNEGMSTEFQALLAASQSTTGVQTTVAVQKQKRTVRVGLTDGDVPQACWIFFQNPEETLRVRGQGICGESKLPIAYLLEKGIDINNFVTIAFAKKGNRIAPLSSIEVAGLASDSEIKIKNPDPTQGPFMTTSSSITILGTCDFDQVMMKIKVGNAEALSVPDCVAGNEPGFKIENLNIPMGSTKITVSGINKDFYEAGIEGFGTSTAELTVNRSEPSPAPAPYGGTECGPSTFAGGSGSMADPFLVANAAQLDLVRNCLNAHFKQIQSISLGPVQTHESLRNAQTYKSFEPIGTKLNPFSGTYDGQNYSISGFSYKASSYSLDDIGLFGSTSQSSQLRRVNLVGVYARGSYGNYSVGGLVGYSESNLIDDCHVSGLVSGESSGAGLKGVGGLVGMQKGGTLSNSSANIIMLDYPAELNADKEVLLNGKTLGFGGLVGNLQDSMIKNSRATGQIIASASGGLVAYSLRSAIAGSSSNVDLTSSSFMGGLVAVLSNSSITSSFSTGPVQLTKINGGFYPSEVGGLVGQASSSSLTNKCMIDSSFSTSSIEDSNPQSSGVGGLLGLASACEIKSSYSTGAVLGTRYVGGLVGKFSNNSRGASGIIEDSYSTGDVTGSYYVGGLVGYLASSVRRSYSKNHVKGDFFVGGFVGYNNGENTFTVGISIKDSYSQSNVEGLWSLGGLVGHNLLGNIENTYSAGTLKLNPGGNVGLPGKLIGGLAAFSDVAALNSYWDFEISGEKNSDAGIPRSTSEMKSGIPFPGWDLNTWKFVPGQYPTL